MIVRGTIIFTGVLVLLTILMSIPAMGLIWAVNLLTAKTLIPFTFWHVVAVGILMAIMAHFIRGKR